MQAGDEDVIEILLKSKNIDINDADADADGNSALHCALKTSMGLSQHVLQNRSLSLLATMHKQMIAFLTQK